MTDTISQTAYQMRRGCLRQSRIRCGQSLAGAQPASAGRMVLSELLQRRRRNERQAAGFAVEAADFHIVEQERRADHGAGNAALR